MTPRTPVSLLVSIAVLVSCTTTSRTTVVASNGPPVSAGVFYDTLAPYGEWIYVGNYGRVWRPSVAVVGAGFRPYGPGGHWVHTDYGWSFESDWSWGWAPFHYGHWYLDPVYGWVWVPGSTWAPAWVTWRYGGGYVGWAPLPPPGAAIVVETYHPYWCFVETRYLVVRDVYHYAMPVQNYHPAFSATVTLQATQGAGGARWSSGPPAAQVSREIGQPIHTANVIPPPPGKVQAHRVAPTPAANNAATAHSAASHSGPPRGTPAEHASAAAPQTEREGGELEHEHAQHRGTVEAAQSHPQAPALPPPPKRKRR